VYAAIAADETLARDGRFADISRMFASEPAGMFLDLGHVSEEGNIRIAGRIAPDLAAALRRR